MARRFRRRNRGRWFPVSVPAIGFTVNYVAGASAQTIDAVPLIGSSLDLPQTINTLSGTSPVSTLAAAIGPGSSYLVKRIVGDVDAALHQTQTEDSHAWAAFAIWVDRVDDLGVLQNLNAWQFFNEVSGPVAGAGVISSLKRWLFRRAWHLGNSASTVANRDAVFPPYSASWYGSNQTGTHIDMKVKARVSPGERLFAGFFLRGGSGGVVSGTQSNCYFNYNLRLFAQPTTYDNR